MTVKTRAEFDAFFRKHVVQLLQHVMRQGFDEECAKESVAETMTALYQRWHEIDHPLRWARRTAYCHALDEVNARRRTRPFDPEDWAARGFVHRDDDPICRQESTARVVRLLGGLPIRRREVISYWLDGYEDHEIAEEMGISEATVRSHRRHALRAITAQLGVEGGGHDRA